MLQIKKLNFYCQEYKVNSFKQETRSSDSTWKVLPKKATIASTE